MNGEVSLASAFGFGNRMRDVLGVDERGSSDVVVAESGSERPCDGGIIIASTHHGTTEEKAENH